MAQCVRWFDTHFHALNYCNIIGLYRENNSYIQIASVRYYGNKLRKNVFI